MKPLDRNWPEKRTILFLEQQSWRSGAQRVLETILETISPDFSPVVVFPSEGDFSKTLRDRNIETIFMPLGTYRSGRKSYAEILAFSGRSLLCGLLLASVLRKRRASLVYINGPRCLPAGVLAAHLAGCPAVFHQHLTLTRRPEVCLVNFLARHLSAIVACSEASARPLLDTGPEVRGKIHIIYNPVSNLARHRRSIGKAPRAHGGVTVGMVGRITEQKGHRHLLNAIGNLRPELREQIQVVFVGAPAPGDSRDLVYSQELHDLSLQLGLQRRIHWAGYQPDPSPFYAVMDVLVQPTSAQGGEGMPLSILEALHEGVPIIASDTGGISEIVEAGVNGLLVPPGDEGALGRVLQRFLEDASLRTRLQLGARATPFDRFSPDSFRSKIREVIWQQIGEDIAREVNSPRKEFRV